MAERHREEDVGLVRPRERQLHDLLERDQTGPVTTRGRELTMISKVGTGRGAVMNRSIPGAVRSISSLGSINRSSPPRTSRNTTSSTPTLANA